MTNEELIKKAAAVVRPKKMKDGSCADVGCALLSASGKLYFGVNVSSGSQNVCAEQVAIGTMIANNEYNFKKIVAVWKDEKGATYVIPPCGNCRQFMRDAGESNLEAEVILNADKSVKLKDLLPYYDWWQRQE